MKRGAPPTPRNARTGELTPPGITSIALANSCSDLVCMCECRLYSSDRFFRFHGEGTKASQPDESWRRTSRRVEKFSLCVMDHHLRIFTHLTELARQLGR